MGPTVFAVIYLLAMVKVVVVGDLVWFRDDARERLMVNTREVLVFAAVYLWFVRSATSPTPSILAGRSAPEQGAPFIGDNAQQVRELAQQPVLVVPERPRVVTPNIGP